MLALASNAEDYWTIQEIADFVGRSKRKVYRILAKHRMSNRPALHWMLAGVAPLDASSGRREHHRLNRTGNRQLNCAIHRIAVTQKRTYEPAKLYLKKKQAEGKTDRAALRSLKRQLIRALFSAMKADEAARRPIRPAA